MIEHEDRTSECGIKLFSGDHLIACCSSLTNKTEGRSKKLSLLVYTNVMQCNILVKSDMFYIFVVGGPQQRVSEEK